MKEIYCPNCNQTTLFSKEDSESYKCVECGYIIGREEIAADLKPEIHTPEDVKETI